MSSTVHDSDISFKEKLKCHLSRIYPDRDIDLLARRICILFHLEDEDTRRLYEPLRPEWSQEDIILITYGNSIVKDDEVPLKTLSGFLDRRLKDKVSIVHILPFFPYSSDEGFAVMDYYAVNPSLGQWRDIEAIAKKYRLMADLVINHTSSRAHWFENFKKGENPGKDYYVTVSPNSDLSQVVRPRTSPLLREVTTPEGTFHVWCTFSHDQVDLDYKNPEVLFEFLAIIRFYLENGIKAFRLDAVAFLWKEVCTTCLHLNQTHEIIRLFRTILEKIAPDVLLITETNVPSRENLSYLGDGNEAHIIYNFPLPPLLLYSLVSSDVTGLCQWMDSLPAMPKGATYLNFIASHDGIGLRPAEGFLSPGQISSLITCMKAFGGAISTRALNDQQSNPYEINISLWDAMKGTMETGPDQHQLDRFVCAHAFMLSLQGIPAFYIHSLLGSVNDYDRQINLNSNRAVNRHIWDADDLESRLQDQTSHYSKVFMQLSQLIGLRKQQAAFHPDADQEHLKVPEPLVGVIRNRKKDGDGASQSISCFFNMSDKSVSVDLSDTVPESLLKCHDLVTGSSFDLTAAPVLLKPYQFMWLSNE